MTSRALLVTLLFLVAAAALLAPAAAAQQDDAEDETPLGAEVAAAVQSTDETAGSEVTDGVYEARIERADERDRDALVEERADRLDRRADRLEQRLAALESANATVAERARAGGALAALAALQRSVTVIEQDGEDAQVEALRERAAAIQGGTQADRARELAGPPAAVAERGPAEAGPPDRPGAPENASPATPGPPDDRGDGADEVPADPPTEGGSDDDQRGAGGAPDDDTERANDGADDDPGLGADDGAPGDAPGGPDGPPGDDQSPPDDTPAAGDDE